MSGARVITTVVFGFLAGVAARSLLPIGIVYAWFAVLVAGAALSYILIDRKKLQVLILVAIALVSFAAGIVRMGAARMTGNPALTAQLDRYASLDGEVVAEPDVRDTSVLLIVDVHDAAVGSTTAVVHARLLAKAPPHTKARYGDLVRVSGILKLPQPFDTGAGGSFDYPDYLAVGGIAYELDRAHVEQTGGNRGNPIYTGVLAIKRAYLDGIASVLPEPQSGLAGGITIGDKRSIGPKLTGEFQRVSLVHVLVLSGYNITVVADALSQAVSFASQVARTGSGLAVIAFFVLAAGGASSAVRAGLMAVIGMYGRRRNRRTHALRVLGGVAFLMAAWNPFVLVFDPGFQLSILATLGLILATPVVEPSLWWITGRLGMREIVASTIGTQLLVMPLLLYQNGMLSPYALPANLLALLVVPAAMFWSFVAGVSGMIAGSYAVPLALPAYGLLSYILAVAYFFAQAPFSGFAIGEFGIVLLIAGYTLIAAVITYENRRTQTARRSPNQM